MREKKNKFSLIKDKECMIFGVAKELWNKCGVYTITNTLDTSKIYIGSAKKLRRRYSHHLSTYRRGCHHCVKLARGFNKYGIENFTFTVMELCEPENMIALEQDYIDRLKPYYNIKKVADSCLGIIHRPDAKSRRKGCDNPLSRGVTQYSMGGDRIRDFGSIRLAAAAVGLKSDAAIINCCQGKKYSAGGFKWSYAGEDLPKREKLGNPNPHLNGVTQYSMRGIKIRDFDTIELAAVAVGLKGGATIISCCKGEQNSAGGFRWSYVGEDIPVRKRLVNPHPHSRGVTQYSMGGDKIRDFATFKFAMAAVKHKSKSAIQRCCQGEQYSAGGFRWSYFGEDLPDREKLGNPNPHLDGVTQYSMCGDKIRDFATIALAAAAVGQKGKANIIDCCQGDEYSAGGFRWSYTGEDLPKKTEPVRYNIRAVTQYTMCGDKIRDFDSIALAAAAVGQKSKSGVLACCQGKNDSAGGFKWSYAGEDLPERKRK